MIDSSLKYILKIHQWALHTTPSSKTVSFANWLASKVTVIEPRYTRIHSSCRQPNVQEIAIGKHYICANEGSIGRIKQGGVKLATIYLKGRRET